MSDVPHPSGPSTETLLRLLEGVAGILILSDGDRRVVYANGRAEAEVGRGRGGLVGRNVDELFPAPAGEAVVAACSRARTEARPVAFEAVLDGGRRRLVLRAYPSSDGFLLVSADPADGGRSENDARAREARFRRLFDSELIGIAFWNVDGFVTEANDAYLALVGYARDEFEREGSLDWRALTPPEYAHLDERAIEECLASGASSVYEKEYVRRDGARVPVVIGATCLEGSRREGVAFVLDNGARKAAERRQEELVAELGANTESLEEERRALETINRISASVAAELDLDRLVQTLTDEATTLVGAQFGSFFYNVLDDAGESYVLYTLSGVPKSAFEGFPMPRNTAIFDPTFRGQGVVRLGDVTKDSRYGKSAPYYGQPKGHLPVRSYLAVPVVSRSGEVIGGLFFGHAETDVFTEWDERVIVGVAAQAAAAMDNARLFDAARRERATAERAREAAEEASRLKDEFLAMVSHELRTPLNSMLGWTRLLRAGRLDEAAAARALETVERNTVSQAQLIEDLLDVSRIVSGKLRLDVRPVELGPVLEAAVDSVRLAAEAKSIRLQTIVDSGAGLVSGDGERLQQVVWNLLSNAIKFTPKGGRVRLELERVDSNARVVVSDTGQGIEPEFLPHIFERFRQADGGVARKHGGLGLGLAIVKHLVEAHGGTVRAESAGAGRGAAFTVTLPLVPVQRASARSASGAGENASVPFECPPELEGVRVLVVDDEPDARAMLKAILEECRAEVRTAGSSSEALDAFDDWRPSALVSDVGMPGEDGYELIRRVRARAPELGGNVPAVALTAYARFEDRMRALSAGFQMHVAKPVEPSELVMVVRTLLDFAAKK